MAFTIIELFMFKSSSLNKREGILLFVIFLTVCLSGVLVTDFQAPLSHGDDRFYDNKALAIIGEKHLTNELEAEPLYPLFLAINYFIFGHSYAVIRIIQILMYGLSVILVYFLVKIIFDKKVALFSCIIFMCSFAVLYPRELYRENLLIFLLLLLLYSLYKIRSSETNLAWFVLAGLFLAFLSLTKIVFFGLLPLIIMNFVYLYKRSIFQKSVFIKIFLFSLTVLFIVVPWFLGIIFFQNYQDKVEAESDIKVEDLVNVFLVERKYLVESYLEHPYKNLVAYFSSYYFVPDVISDDQYPWEIGKYRHLDSLFELEGRGKSKSEAYKVLGSRAVDYFKERPLNFIYISVFSFLDLNTPGTDGMRLYQFFAGTHPEIPNFIKSFLILSVRLIWFIFAVFIVYAIWKYRKNWPKIGWLLIVIFYMNLFFALAYGNPKHAVPMYSLYAILFSLGVVTLLRKKSVVKN